MPKLYEILWKYPNRKKPGEFYVLKVADFLNVTFPSLYRNQVVSIDKAKLEKTIEHLKMIAAEDEEFFIVEKEIEYYD